MPKLTLIAVILILLAGTILAQAPKSGKQSNNTKLKMKTIRLHIDGFQKSKSGAV